MVGSFLGMSGTNVYYGAIWQIYQANQVTITIYSYSGNGSYYLVNLPSLSLMSFRGIGHITWGLWGCHLKETDQK